MKTVNEDSVHVALTKKLLSSGAFDMIVHVGLEDMLDICMGEIENLNNSYPLKDYKIADLQANIEDARYLIGAISIFSCDKNEGKLVLVNKAEDKLCAYLGLLEF